MKTTTTQNETPVTAGGETRTEETPECVTLNEQTPEGVTLNGLQTENEQLKAAIRLRDARESVTEELKRSGARSPGLLFEAVTGDLQFDDEGKPANTAALVARLKTAFPEQFGSDTPQSIDGGAGLVRKPALSKDALRRMKPAEIAELDWSEVRRVLSSG